MENKRPEFDQELIDICNYVTNYQIISEAAYQTAYYDLLDTLACGLLALNYPECTKLLGPVVPNAIVPEGVRVPGTNFRLDPIQAAFNIGAIIRWLDYNDTWLAKEWGHPSDNLGGILAAADYHASLCRKNNTDPLLVRDLLTAQIKAHEIQGNLAIENSFNSVGLDHVILVKVATTAVVSHLLGATPQQILNALSLAFLDGHSLRTYRHAPNTGSRKSWAAGDATSRGVRLALIALTGEMGYPSVLSAKTWGFYDVYFNGKPFSLQRGYGNYVMENVLFKISYPAEFHAQTAVECAILLHEAVKHQLDHIEQIKVRTTEPAVRIISKQGPLYNPADRDHCLEYMIAIGLIYGDLTADHYEDKTAKDPRIDILRAKMQVIEDPVFSKNYLNPEKRSIGNAIQIFFKDGSKTEEIAIEYPVGHRCRRKEGIPLLLSKFQNSVKGYFAEEQANTILSLCENKEQLLNTPVDRFLDHWVK